MLCTLPCARRILPNIQTHTHEKLDLTTQHSPNPIPYSYLIFLPFGQKDGWEKIEYLSGRTIWSPSKASDRVTMLTCPYALSRCARYVAESCKHGNVGMKYYGLKNRVIEVRFIEKRVIGRSDCSLRLQAFGLQPQGRASRAPRAEQRRA